MVFVEVQRKSLARMYEATDDRRISSMCLTEWKGLSLKSVNKGRAEKILQTWVC